MWNPTGSSGVYCAVRRVMPILVCALAALAQKQFQQDPMDAAIQAFCQARNDNHLEDAAAAREQARSLLQHVPANSQRFPGWAQQIAQLYQNSGWIAQARAVLQEALARTAPLGDSNLSHFTMLNSLGESWRQDGNLLKALGYLEQAAAAPVEPAAAPAAYAQPLQGVISFGNRFSYAGPAGGGSFQRINVWSRLADLYQQLGRPEMLAVVTEKIRTLASTDQAALARFYEQHGQLDDAAAIYKKLAEGSVDPQSKINAVQSLASVYARQEQYADAIAATQQAIEAVQSSGKPAIQNQTIWMRQNMAGYMRQAGLLDQADQVYRQLLQESRNGPQEMQMLSSYAQYLSETERTPQAQTLLENYLAGGSILEPQQKIGALFTLSNVARRAGDPQGADAYQQAAMALQPQQQAPVPAGQFRIADEAQQAHTALNQHRLDDAYNLTRHAVDSAGQASDGRQVEGLIPQVANALVANKQPAKAELLFRRFIALAQTWKPGDIQPLISVTQNYANFTMYRADHAGDVPAALEQFRSALSEANGPDSAMLVEPLRLKLQFERSQSLWGQAEGTARDLLELQESLSSNTSEPYLGDLQTVARIYETSGDYARALPLRRKAMNIAGLVARSHDDWRISQTRMDTALALAHLGQFDEAETLAQEALALKAPQRTPRPPLEQELEQIRRMKQAASSQRR